MLPEGVCQEDENLSELLLPSNLRSIGTCALTNSGIKTFVIPNTVVRLYDAALGGTKIESITVPSSVVDFGEEVFAECENLKTAKLYCNIKKIPVSTFEGCKSLESVTLPSGITEIGAYAFYECNNLRISSIPNNITKIDAWAFANTAVDFDLPTKLTSLGSGAFSSTNMTKADFAQPDCTIGSSAFQSCSLLTQVTLPANLTAIEGSVFASTGITQIELPSTVTKINTHAFEKTNLESIQLPNNLEYLYDYAFNDCRNLKMIDLSNTKIKSIGQYAFYNNTSLKSVKLPTELMLINSYAFYNCTALTAISLPDSVSKINTKAFANCNLKTVEILNDNIDIAQLNNSKIGFNSQGGNTGYNTLTIMAHTGTAGETYAKNNNFNFYAIGHHDEQNTAVPNNGYTNNPDIEWFVDGTELHITGVGALTSKGFYGTYTDELLDETFSIDYTFSHIIEEKGITKLVVEEGITALPEKLFYGATYDQSTLTEVSLPSTLKTIGEYTFAQSNIESITIPNSVTSIGSYAFYQADLHNGVTLGTGIKKIPAYAFADTSLNSIDIPDNVTALGEHAFY